MNKIIKSEEEYQTALNEIDSLMDLNIDPGTPESDQLELLVLLIENYEAINYPIERPDPIEQPDRVCEFKIITKGKWEMVKAATILKLEEIVNQDEDSFEEWWSMEGENRWSFCDNFSCKCCPLYNKKGDHGRHCAKEHSACDDAYVDENYEDFHKASVTLLKRIGNIEYEDLLEVRGTHNG